MFEILRLLLRKSKTFLLRIGFHPRVPPAICPTHFCKWPLIGRRHKWLIVQDKYPRIYYLLKANAFVSVIQEHAIKS